MPRRSHTFSIALCASLALHAAILWAFVHALINNPIWLAGWSRAEVVQAELDAQPIYVFPATQLPDTQLGAADGSGHAIDPAPGDQPLEARQGMQDQQFLSRDPAGPGEVGNEPSPSVLPRDVEAAPSAPPAPFGVASTASPIPSGITRESNEGRGRLSDHAAPITDAPSHSTQAPPTASAAKATSNLPPADPAPMSDSETDPYSVKGSVRFLPGKTDVQFGRKHKIVRPRFDLAAKTALLSLQSPIVIALKLDLDAQGNVTHVDFVKRSGSDDIDQAISVAAYKWWLEPTKDKAGKAIADSVPFLIRLD